MSEMIERVARALCAEEYKFEEYAGEVTQEEYVTHFWPKWSAEARAAIEAMRGITPTMEHAGIIAFRDTKTITFAYRAMIDEALK